MHTPVKQYLGFFRKQLTMWQAVALIVSATIGAGVLGIPYAVAQVGVLPGVLLIVALGIAMMIMHVLLATVCAHTGKSLQLVGLARTYLGRTGEVIMMFAFYVSMLSGMLIYIIGVGETLAAMFGGSAFVFSVGFWIFASLLVMRGIKTMKTVELVLSLGMLLIIFFMSAVSAPHISVENLMFYDLAKFAIPYGVSLFAFSAVSAVPEAHALLPKKKKQFTKAVILAGSITTVLYALFAFMIVSVTGGQTTQIATIGLGSVVGPQMVYLGNAFAVIAMATSFLLVGLALKHSCEWDLSFSKRVSGVVVLGLPLLLFTLGITSFIGVLGAVGGILVSIQMILVVLIFIKALHIGDVYMKPSRAVSVKVLSIVLLLLLLGGMGVSIAQQF
ncbi:MAG: hypothetical protein HOE53_02375 [Candidatus Magasanikbacteria bacterium]|jgi:tyrosine-specific transport protein|nr:hypothetical protein [Candidatus Magasanikbacteria bacterium]